MLYKLNSINSSHVDLKPLVRCCTGTSNVVTNSSYGIISGLPFQAK